MDGLAWTTAIWALLLFVAFSLRFRIPGVRSFFTRPNLAVLLALLGTFSVAGQREAEAVLEDPLVIERVLRGGLSALAILLAGPYVVRGMLNGNRPGRRGWAAIVVYLLVAGVSTVYSAAPVVTAGKVFELAAGVIAVAAVAYGPRPWIELRRTFTLVILAMAALVVAGVIGFFLLPDAFGPIETRPGFVTVRTLSPPYAHSNAMSSMSAIVGVLSLARVLTAGLHRRLWAVTAVVSFVALVLSSGRQGVVMYLAGTLVVLAVTRRRLLFLALGPALILTIWAYAEVLLDVLSRDRPQNLVTLTGRLGMWDAAIGTWIQHPWTGWGYGSGGRFVALESIGQSSISSLHSGYFEILTGVGLLGAIPLAYALLRAVSWAWERLRSRRDIGLAVVVGLLMIRTGVSLGFGGWLTMELLLFLLLVAISDLDRLAARPTSKARSPAPVAGPVTIR